MKKNIDLPEVDPVELKPFLGMRPGIVIILLAVLAALLIFFLVFMLPGIVSGGRKVSFTSDSSNIGVFIDGTYAGSTTDGRFRIESGDHEIEYMKDGVRFGKGTMHVDHPIFFTLFRVPKMDVKVDVPPTAEMKRAVLEGFTDDLEKQSRILFFNDVVRYKPIFRDLARDIISLGIDTDEDFWLYAISHISGIEMKEDYETAKEMLSENGISIPADDSVLDKVEFGRDDNDYENINETTYVSAVKDGFAEFEGGNVTMGEYDGNAYPFTNEKNITEGVEPFAIAMDPVSEYEYALFVEDNPMWSLGNKAGLIEAGLVDENYLNGITLTTDWISNKPIVNVSWHAANAYADWKGLRLPTEAEWIYAANSIMDKKPATTITHKDLDEERLRNMMGLVWEFTSSDYAPLSRMMDQDVPGRNADIIIKGGSWLMKPGTYDQYSVGVTTPEKCSEAFGFRLAKDN